MENEQWEMCVFVDTHYYGVTEGLEQEGRAPRLEDQLVLPSIFTRAATLLSFYRPLDSAGDP